MSLLDRKLRRDIGAIRGQVITIALVVAAGVAVFVASISTYQSLSANRDSFYATARFPHIFVTLKRAPLSIVSRLGEIPGISAVEPRIVKDVIVDWPASALPVSARIVSIANGGDEPLARLHLRQGIAPGPGETRALAVNEAFAEANRVRPGDQIRVILNGRLEAFHISGIALSPEHVYAIKPGLPIPDDRLFAVLWIDRGAAEAAFDMKGAFNDLVVTLAPGVDPQAVITELDRLLEPYGSVGAIARRDQPSNRFLEDELNQQKVMSITIPFIFFGVAAFLLNVSLSRIVAAQREQIAALKALGFPTTPLVLHYLKLVAVIVGIGSAAGIAAGWGFGQAMIASYHGFFRFPVLEFAVTPWSAAVAVAISFAAAAIGGLTALGNVVRVPPAIAMRPAAPMRYRRSWLERAIARIKLPVRHIMTARNMFGRPLRPLMTIVGVAFAVPMVVLGLFWRDAIDHMIDVQYNFVERGNVTVTFTRPFDRRIIEDLAREAGVLAIEEQRLVPVRLRAGHRSYLTGIIGLAPGSTLRRPHDLSLRPVEVSPEGITLSRQLAARLGVTTGDAISIEVMEGLRRTRDLAVSAVIEEVVGMGSYMDIAALNGLTGEGAVVSAAAMYVDPSALSRLSVRLKEMPTIASVSVKTYALSSFLDKIANLVLVTAGILTVFAVIIAVGVVYNSSRISFQERSWEMASLRVLGFTRAEVGRIVSNEFLIEIAIGIPIGLALSQAIVTLISRFHSNESFQIPAVIGPRTYVAAVAVVLIAAAVSILIVRRRIDRLDMVAALKARD